MRGHECIGKQDGDFVIRTGQFLDGVELTKLSKWGMWGEVELGVRVVNLSYWKEEDTLNRNGEVCKSFGGKGQKTKFCFGCVGNGKCPVKFLVMK